MTFAAIDAEMQLLDRPREDDRPGGSGLRGSSDWLDTDRGELQFCRDLLDNTPQQWLAELVRWQHTEGDSLIALGDQPQLVAFCWLKWFQATGDQSNLLGGGVEVQPSLGVEIVFSAGQIGGPHARPQGKDDERLQVGQLAVLLLKLQAELLSLLTLVLQLVGGLLELLSNFAQFGRHFLQAITLLIQSISQLVDRSLSVLAELEFRKHPPANQVTDQRNSQHCQRKPEPSPAETSL